MKSSITPVKHLNRDLITSGYSSLIDNHQKYANYAEKDHNIANDLIASFKKANDKTASHQGYKAVVQALFESEFLSVKDRDFNTEKLFNYIYGVKCVHSVPSFQKLHSWLMDNDFTDHIGTLEPSSLYESKGSLVCFDCDKTYPLSHVKETGCTNCKTTTNQKTFNSSGDNYYSAYQFEHKLSDIQKGIIDMSPEDSEDRLTTFDRVIVVENQSPMWAFVLTESAFSGEPDEFSIVRLKCNYDDKDRLPELLELVKNNKLKNNHDWSTYNDTSRYGVIAHVKIEDMECKPVLQPKHIESALFNLYSGVDSLEL
jgi:hypothetical protein